MLQKEEFYDSHLIDFSLGLATTNTYSSIHQT